MTGRTVSEAVIGTVRLPAAVLAICVLAEPVVAQPPNVGGEAEAYYTLSDIEVTDGAYFATTSIWAALNGDWSRPGLTVKAYIGSGQYDYASGEAAGGRIDVVPISADLMIGYYGAIGSAAYWNVLIGVGIQSNELDPNDPSNPVRGSEVGFKVAADLEADDERKFYYHLEGDYTTAYETYWSRARVGYGFGGLIAGPEGTFFGDETYNAQRIGGFVRFYLQLPGKWEPVVVLAGGYEYVQEEDAGPSGEGFGGIGGTGNGPYGSASIEFTF